MIIYLATFIISICLLILSNLLKKKYKIVSKCFLLFSLFLPCLLAGLRSENIGTDVLVYIKPYFDAAKNYNNYFDFMIAIKSSDYLFYFLIWFFSKYCAGISLLLFLIEVLVIVPVYISLNKVKKNDNDIIIGMSIFYFVWYDLSFNMARQSVAMAFSILALVLFQENKKIKSIFTVFLAILFHNSAIIMLLILFLYSILRGNEFNKKIFFRSFFIFFSMILILLLFKNILSFFSNIITTENVIYKYVNYVNVFGSAEVKWKQLIMWIIFLLLTFAFSNPIKQYTNNYYFYLLILIISIFGFYADSIIQYSHRIFLYFSYPFLYIILARLPFSLKNKFNKFIAIILIVGITFSFWISSSVIGNGNHTMPYEFAERL